MAAATAIAFISKPPKSHIALAKMRYHAAVIVCSPVGWLHFPAIKIAEPATRRGAQQRGRRPRMARTPATKMPIA